MLQDDKDMHEPVAYYLVELSKYVRFQNGMTSPVVRLMAEDGEVGSSNLNVCKAKWQGKKFRNNKIQNEID